MLEHSDKNILSDKFVRRSGSSQCVYINWQGTCDVLLKIENHVSKLRPEY
jgi:hypothetical protein